MKHLFLLLAIALSANGQSVWRNARLANVTGAPASGPTVIATDDFNRADLGGAWTQGTAYTPIIWNNYLEGVSGQTSYMYTNSTFADAQYSKLTFPASNSALSSYNRGAGCAARMSGTGATLDGYVFFTDGSSGTDHTAIFRLDDGALTLIKSLATTVTDGDVLELRASGTTLSAYKNGDLIDSVTDATYSSGDAGIMIMGQAHVDSWEGGNL